MDERARRQTDIHVGRDRHKNRHFRHDCRYSSAHQTSSSRVLTKTGQACQFSWRRPACRRPYRQNLSKSGLFLLISRDGSALARQRAVLHRLRYRSIGCVWTLFARAACLCAAASLTASVASAQTARGSLRGIVNGAGGAAPAADVILTDEIIHVSRQAVSNESGEYLFPDLAPGRYSITVSLGGFETQTRLGIDVRLAEVFVDFDLQAGTNEGSRAAPPDFTAHDSRMRSIRRVPASFVRTDEPQHANHCFASGAATAAEGRAGEGIAAPSACGVFETTARSWSGVRHGSPLLAEMSIWAVSQLYFGSDPIDASHITLPASTSAPGQQRGSCMIPTCPDVSSR